MTTFGRPVAVLFQPHRFSRTARFAREFADALAAADAVGLLPIYPAGEEPQEGVDSKLIARILHDKGIEQVTLVVADEIEAWLADHVRSGDLLLTLGAGDVGRLVGPLCKILDNRSDV